MQYSSIKFRLSLAFYLFLFLVTFIGAFGIACLNDFNNVTDQLRTRWLPNTRFLGDLNNYTSDFRAAEGTLLLSSDPEDVAENERIMRELDGNIDKARKGYESIFHEGKESILYENFSANWDAYHTIVKQDVNLMHEGSVSDSVKIYKTSSQTAYNAASDALGLLTDLNVTLDQEASDRASATYQKARTLICIAMVAGAMMLIAGVTYIRSHISTPLLALAEKMRLIADDTTDVDIEVTGRTDEIGEMEHAIQVFRNNTLMLQEKFRKERELLEMQRNFISMASHEFRTPLNIIDGHAQRLLKVKPETPAEEIAARAHKLRECVQQMTALIDNLLNSARMFEENPKMYFQPTNVDVALMLREIAAWYEEMSGIKIAQEITAPLMLSGDAKLLQQVFGNLIANAIKYSPEGGSVEISAVLAGKKAVITVQDHGMGIPKGELDKIFDRYARGSNVSDIAGTGIGLYLARMIVEMHGGEITAESVEGKGSRFTVWLPA